MFLSGEVSLSYMVVSRTTSDTASSINNLLEERDIVGLLTVAAGSAGGVILTQRIANSVLPAVGLSPTPSSITEGAASAGLKTAIAGGFMYAALQTTGVPQTLLAFLSIGSLTSAGFDLVSLFFDVPSLAQSKAKKLTASSRRSGTSNRVKASVKSASKTTRTKSTRNDEMEFRQGAPGDEEEFR